MNYYLLSVYNQNYIYKNNDIKNISINMRHFDNEFSYLSTYINELTIINFMYHPFLLYLLHNKGLYSIPCFDIFDYILQVKQQHIVPFELENFKFDDSLEWTHTPYNIIGTDFKNKNAVARVTDDGFIYAIDIYKDKFLFTRYFIDCRGFVSSKWSILNNTLLTGIFFNPNGEKIFKLEEDGSIKIFKNSLINKFNSTYKNIFDFLCDAFNLIWKSDSNDLFFAELNQANFDIANTLFDSRNISYLYFGNNIDDSDIKKLIERFKSSNRIYVDSPDKISKLNRIAKSDNKLDFKVVNIYDRRIKSNESNFVGYNKILIYVDSECCTQLDESVSCIFKNIKKINKAYITFIYKTKFDEKLKNKIYKYAANYNLGNNMINFVYLNDDITLFKEFSDTRLFINIANSIDIYLQQSAFRAAIPQLNFISNGNINEKKNGITVNNANELADATIFYLDNLDYWNRTFTYCKKTYGD